MNGANLFNNYNNYQTYLELFAKGLEGTPYQNKYDKTIAHLLDITRRYPIDGDPAQMTSLKKSFINFKDDMYW